MRDNMKTTLEEGTFKLVKMTRYLEDDGFRYSQIFDKSREAIAVCRDGVNSFINPALIKMFGFNSEEEIADRFPLNLIAPKERKRAATYIKRKIQGENVPNIFETIGIRKDKTEFNIEALVSAYEINGKHYFITILRDVTERKKLEKLTCKSRKRLESLTKRIITVQEDERLNISRDLHDDVGQKLTALKIQINLIGDELPVGMESIHEKLGNASELIDQLMNSIHSLAKDLRPPVLDTLGLEHSLRDLCDDFINRIGVNLDYVIDPLPKLPESIQITLYRFLQEALTNIVKHSRASNVNVQIYNRGSVITICVLDNGVGFNPDDISFGMGINNMKERIQLVDGNLEIQSHPGAGTQLKAFMPLDIDFTERQKVY